ncbi:oxidoreductase [Striga asiatica]|uniref:Oxidoreductase n=1 Tax=Striga asiatica TaxID=4170 RepID=A0A5A7P7P8_STRAF|nr:oxidoreductase [Striga asiatica]
MDLSESENKIIELGEECINASEEKCSRGLFEGISVHHNGYLWVQVNNLPLNWLSSEVLSLGWTGLDPSMVLRSHGLHDGRDLCLWELRHGQWGLDMLEPNTGMWRKLVVRARSSRITLRVVLGHYGSWRSARVSRRECGLRRNIETGSVRVAGRVRTSWAVLGMPASHAGRVLIGSAHCGTGLRGRLQLVLDGDLQLLADINLDFHEEWTTP